MACDNPALLFTPGGCSVADPPLGPFRWQFGDGGTSATPTEGRARASFSPFVRHAYARAGTYQVSVAVTSNGSTDRVTVPVTVHPALRVAIGRAGGRAVAVVGGGDGHVLYERWTLPDGSPAFGPTVAVPASGQLTLTAVDGTGATATAASDVASLPPAAANASRDEASAGSPSGVGGSTKGREAPSRPVPVRLGAKLVRSWPAPGASGFGMVLGAVVLGGGLVSWRRRGRAGRSGP
jgi:hypothetical protein